MPMYLGDFPVGATIYVPFHTFSSDDPSASMTITGLAATDIEIYKNGNTTQRASDAGYTLLDTDGIDFDSITGVHAVSIDTSDDTDSGFFVAGADYWVVVSSITLDGATINFVAAIFSIENRRTAGELIRTTIATLASQTSFTLTAGSADDNAYNGCTIVVSDSASAVQKAIGYVSDYTGSTKTVTLAADPGIFTMAVGDNVSIIATSALADVHAIQADKQSATDLKDLADTGYDPSSHKVQGVVLADTTTAVTNGVGLADDAITSAKYDESTAFPVASADSGATEIARTGADSDTLETLSDQIDAVPTASEIQTEMEENGASILDTLQDRLGTPADIDGGGATIADNLKKLADDNGGATFDATNDSLNVIRDQIDAVPTASEIQTEMEEDGASLLDTIRDQIGTAGAGLTDLGGMSTGMKAEVEAECTDAIEADGLDHLVAASVAGADVADNSVIAKMVSKNATADWDTFVNTTDSLEAARDKQTDIETDTQDLQTQVGTAGAGLTAVPWNSAWDAEVQSEVADALDVAVPGSPTADSINERVKAIDDKLPSKSYLTGSADSDGGIDTTEAAVINAEVDTALNTAIPGSPTADSVNERVKAIDDKLPSKSYLSGSADSDGGIDSTEAAVINGEVDDVISTDANTELSSVPDTTGTLRQMVQFLFEYFRNKRTVNATTETMYKEDASTSLGTASLSDDSTTFTKGEMS